MILMESVSLHLSVSFPYPKPPNILSVFQSPKNPKCLLKLSQSRYYLLPLVLTHPFTLTSLPALATADSPPQQQKINLEAVVVSIDDFFIKYPFFVTLVGVIWLVIIPLAQYYISRYKYTSALNAFQKLRDDPYAALLDIRDDKSLAFLATPDLTLLNKTALHLHFDDQDEGMMLFVNAVLHKFEDPSNAIVCVIDNFDGNSLKVAELLVKNGFKEAYAIKGGVRGKKGWQEIQEDVFPPSVRVYPKKKLKSSKQNEVNENGSLSSANGSITKPMSSIPDPCNIFLNKSVSCASETKPGFRSSSPYPNHPDLRPPSSPTPSKPKS